ncbi:hypothetical protein D9615_000056 [Tricholomella constricta]|uniref:Uncharacterized protein n=1 Tax=Tricholomella constricta TaxID=117010 RepID=A0A8H5HS54_9AGAR|nr:hypothetical protein D9615_000056 [Tricholomella constricta]
MNFTNINDPAGVKALLDQLRVSQAWQQAVAPTPLEPQESPATVDQELAPVPSSPGPSAIPSALATSTSVAALLSQLQSSPSWPPSNATISEHNPGNPMPPVTVELASPPTPPRPKKIPDPKSLTFQQALPHLARLGDDPGFVAAITRLKKEQNDLERQLWEDRRDIHRKYEERLKVAITKANMMGDPGLSKHEADMLQNGLKKSLEKFDRERVLIAWDGLISKQQATLAQHGVPTMFPTNEATDRERQQRVMQVLEGLSVNCALRFAVLFPEMCLSLTLCSVPPPMEVKWVMTAYDELLNNWCCAEDLESFEHVAKESVVFLLGQDCDSDIRDDLIAYWQTSMPPARILRIAETLSVVMNRSPLKPDVLASITHPVLLLHGEQNETCPKVHAEKLASQLTNAEGSAVLYPVKGASGTLSIVPWHASIANKVFTNFLSRLPPMRSELLPPETNKTERMKAALGTLAEIIGDASIALRNPSSSLSFCCLPQDVVKRQADTLKQYRKGIHTAFSPVGPDGRPVRKYSERTNEHWFHGEKDGLSYAGNSNFLPPGRSKDYDRDRAEKPASPQEPAIDNRLRRNTNTFNPSSVDKQVIKGSMAKVVATPAAQFQRLLV